MRLSSIKLAGFKSFVDPTTVKFPTNMSAVVGPNGCGKSNIIDAVRWVMGESSAKHLRGESMTDVIFNGSGNRKPVNQASIELVFDNSDGTLAGEYAAFSEISIRRVVTSEAQSQYYLNGTKCRRRDITDIFLGTGLGPRSYAIIEQGMISRLIESKPEELRVYIEEAAGISKYKERRRETENRMRRTKENLERLTDLREEMERQLSRLQRQSQAAEKYKTFKADERQKKAELAAIQWRNLDGKASNIAATIRELEVTLEAHIAEQRKTGSQMETFRQAHTENNDKFNEVQGRYYSYGAEIARIEQSIQHQEQRVREFRSDLAQVEQNYGEMQRHLDTDAANLVQWQEEMTGLEAELETANMQDQELHDKQLAAEEQMQSWQQQWDDFNQRAALPKQQAEVEQSRIRHFEQAMQRSAGRIEKLESEHSELGLPSADESIDELTIQLVQEEEKIDSFEEQSQSLLTAIRENRDESKQLSEQLDKQRSELQRNKGRMASLEALQQAALGQKNEAVAEWLSSHQLQEKPRLGETLNVESGWETAVETVLGDYLQAVCVDGIDEVAAWVGGLQKGKASFYSTSHTSVSSDGRSDAALLESKISASNGKPSSLLAGVYAADNLQEALNLRGRLAGNESVITREGVWLGPNWLRVVKDNDQQAGIIQRQREMENLSEAITAAEETIHSVQSQLELNGEKLKESEQLREQVQRDSQQLARHVSELRASLSAQQAKIEQSRARREAVEHELQELKEQYAVEQQTLAESRIVLQEALDAMTEHTDEQENLLLMRDQSRSTLDEVKQQARRARDHAHQLTVRFQSLKTQTSSVTANIERSKAQVTQLKERSESLRESLSTSAEPVEEMKMSLEEALQKRLDIEGELQAARTEMESVETQLREAEKRRDEIERDAQQTRSELEQSKLAMSEFNVRRKTLEEQLQKDQFNLEQIILGLPADASEGQWLAELEEIDRRVQRLGPINLAAIDEYKSQSERKMYLDSQNDDLEQALTTLENAIRRIDKETRNRFKETFDQVNSGLQALFPKVFGGGSAHLEMTGEDLLDTGVTIMARPPGKRNSTIHLLSGGEKALTAIALVFSIFKLNPAPFCMLDEVDAPLDDANVGRYANMVKEMSDQVQFIYITHNKISMEQADQLMGVTMHEPGVSRLVSVDVQEAAELAEA